MQSAIDPNWPDGDLVAFQCSSCLHSVKALQSAKPTCCHPRESRCNSTSGGGPLVTMGCHGQLLTGPYFPAAWLQVCADCSHGKDASAWEQFSDPVNGKCQTSLCVYCCPQSAILPKWQLLPEETHPPYECLKIPGISGSTTVCSFAGFNRVCSVAGCSKPSNAAVHRGNLEYRVSDLEYRLCDRQTPPPPPDGYVHPTDDDTTEEEFPATPEDDDSTDDELVGAQPEDARSAVWYQSRAGLWRWLLECLNRLSLSPIRRTV